jgi:predicted DNA-binding protein
LKLTYQVSALKRLSFPALSKTIFGNFNTNAGNLFARNSIMSALTLRLPDHKYQRLKQLAKTKGVSVNYLLDEMTTLMLAEFDLKTQFEIRAQRGRNNQERGLALLEKAKSNA